MRVDNLRQARNTQKGTRIRIEEESVMVAVVRERKQTNVAKAQCHWRPIIGRSRENTRLRVLRPFIRTATQAQRFRLITLHDPISRGSGYAQIPSGFEMFKVLDQCVCIWARLSVYVDLMRFSRD